MPKHLVVISVLIRRRALIEGWENLKKFETFSDSVVVEALKVMIIVVVEAGFPCIPVILESEGRGEHLFERGVFI